MSPWPVLEWYGVHTIPGLVEVCLESLRGKDLLTQLKLQGIASITKSGEVASISGWYPAIDGLFRLFVSIPPDNPVDVDVLPMNWDTALRRILEVGRCLRYHSGL